MHKFILVKYSVSKKTKEMNSINVTINNKTYSIERRKSEYVKMYNMLENVNENSNVIVSCNSNIKTIKELKTFLECINEYGTIVLELCENYNVEEVNTLIENQLIETYETIKDLIIDVLKIPGIHYKFLSIAKCINEIRIKYNILLLNNKVYLFTKINVKKKVKLNINFESKKANRYTIANVFTKQAKLENWNKDEINSVLLIANKHDFNKFKNTIKKHCYINNVPVYSFEDYE